MHATQDKPEQAEISPERARKSAVKGAKRAGKQAQEVAQCRFPDMHHLYLKVMRPAVLM